MDATDFSAGTTLSTGTALSAEIDSSEMTGSSEIGSTPVADDALVSKRDLRYGRSHGSVAVVD